MAASFRLGSCWIWRRRDPAPFLRRHSVRAIARPCGATRVVAPPTFLVLASTPLSVGYTLMWLGLWISYMRCIQVTKRRYDGRDSRRILLEEAVSERAAPVLVGSPTT